MLRVVGRSGVADCWITFALLGPPAANDQPFGVPMKGIATAIVLMWMSSAGAAEIRCQDAPGREQNGVFWSWREIEGKRCWFLRAGRAMPPKSEFTWAKEEPVQGDAPAVPEKTTTGQRTIHPES